ncbi:MAG: ATP-binding cassette domain-containing protein [Candidatus Acidiferrales bacterium]
MNDAMPTLTPAAATVDTSAAVVSFDNVRLGFDEGEILRGLTFHVDAGETKVLVGETGAGKTLALKLAAGLIHADAGSVRVLGQDLGILTEQQLYAFRRKIGFVFQEGALFDSLTVGENVAYRLREDQLEEDEIETRVREALRFVELEHTIESLPSELSGGMRRRVGIARALVDRPAIVLYDSPTAGLDPITSQIIMTMILRLRDSQGVTSLLATHRLQDAFGLANYRFDAAANRVVRDSAAVEASAHGSSAHDTRFVVLRNGETYFEGEPRALAESSDAYLKQFLV